MYLLSRDRSRGLARWVGEILLIFVGITAALSVDSWKDERDEQRAELAVLREINSALASDTADLKDSVRRFGTVVSATDEIIVAFDAGRSYEVGLAQRFSDASLQTISFLDDAAYQRLLGLGLDLITNDDLRREIAQYYEIETEYLQVIEERWIHEVWRTSVLPQMLEKFAYEFIRRPAVPHDFGSLRTDVAFRTMLTTHREAVIYQRFLAERVLDRAELLSTHVKEELAKH